MRRRWLLLAILGALALGGLWWLYTVHAGFPIGFHQDEPKKVQFALTQEQDFHHPILMIQAMRVAREVLGIATPEAMLAVGRRLSAFYTLIGVVLSALLYRQLLRPAWAVAAAAALAVTPLLAVHAHYIKEDAIFLAAVSAALWALVRFARAPERGALTLGLTMGLALAAQYKAILFVALAFVLPYLGAAPRTDAYFRVLRRATAIAVGVFVLVCYPMLLSFSTFGGGFTNQVGHVFGGHYVKIYAIPQLFTYHLRESLIPGLTPPIVALAVGGVVWAVASWHRLDAAWRIALLYLAVFYLSAELSPSKPPPDFMRYMMPAAPVVVAIAFRLLQEASDLRGRWAGAVAVLISGIALFESVQLVSRLERDTRYVAADVVASLEAQGARMRTETYAGVSGTDLDHFEVGSPEDLREEGYTHLVLSSFAVDRYLLGERLAYQREQVYESADHMHRLLAQPHVTVRPELRSFAYSNPTIWIIDVRAESTRQ